MNSTNEDNDVRLFKYACKFYNVLFHPRYPDGKKHNEKQKKSFPFSSKCEHKILSTIGNILLNRQPYGWNTTLKYWMKTQSDQLIPQPLQASPWPTSKRKDTESSLFLARSFCSVLFYKVEIVSVQRHTSLAQPLPFADESSGRSS